MDTTAATALFVAERFDQPNPVAHLATAGPSAMGVFTYCTGRHVTFAVAVDRLPTCRSCLAKAARNGLDPAEVLA